MTIENTNDKEIRRALIKSLIFKMKKGSPYRVLEEFSVSGGDSIIDLTLVNGVMHGFEIKSDIDSFARLDKQARDYSKVFDYLTIVVGRKHLHSVVSRVPDSWGIIVALKTEGEIKLIDLRKASKNDSISRLHTAQLLWRTEAIKVLDEAGESRGLKSKPKHDLQLRLLELFSLGQIQAQVRKSILARQ